MQMKRVSQAMDAIRHSQIQSSIHALNDEFKSS